MESVQEKVLRDRVYHAINLRFFQLFEPYVLNSNSLFTSDTEFALPIKDAQNAETERMISGVDYSASPPTPLSRTRPYVNRPLCLEERGKMEIKYTITESVSEYLA